MKGGNLNLKTKKSPNAETKKKARKAQVDTVQEAEKLLNRKKGGAEHHSDDDSSDEEMVVRTGNVPRKWYDDYEHSGYSIDAQKVIKPKEDDEIEKFMKRTEDKNWWRNIYDDMNNKTIYISDKDMELIKRIRNNMFINKKAEEDSYFERDIPYQIHPVSSHLPSKKSFTFSRHDRKAINRIIYGIKNGYIKLDEETKPKEVLYDLWTYENTDPNQYHPGKGYQAPKRELPDTDISYNPPDNDTNPSLRRMPRFDGLIEENFERCCDLVISSRFVRKKQDIKEEDILPQLPTPEELKPFPTKQNILYRGHESSVRTMAIEPSGKFLISGDSAGFVYFWDIQTAKIIKRIDFNDDVQNIEYNNTLNLITVCGKEKIYFVQPHYLPKSTKQEVSELVNSKIRPLIDSKQSEETAAVADNATVNSIYTWKYPKSGSRKEENGVLFYIKWKEGVINDLVWHGKGDYFATLSKNSQGKSQVYIHSLSRLIHQTPFSKIKGTINTISFHPTKPQFLVGTNSNIFVYNLQKQVKLPLNM